MAMPIDYSTLPFNISKDVASFCKSKGLTSPLDRMVRQLMAHFPNASGWACERQELQYTEGQRGRNTVVLRVRFASGTAQAVLPEKIASAKNAIGQVVPREVLYRFRFIVDGQEVILAAVPNHNQVPRLRSAPTAAKPAYRPAAKPAKAPVASKPKPVQPAGTPGPSLDAVWTVVLQARHPSDQAMVVRTHGVVSGDSREVAFGKAAMAMYAVYPTEKGWIHAGLEVKPLTPDVFWNRPDELAEAEVPKPRK